MIITWILDDFLDFGQIPGLLQPETRFPLIFNFAQKWGWVPPPEASPDTFVCSEMDVSARDKKVLKI